MPVTFQGGPGDNPKFDIDGQTFEIRPFSYQELIPTADGTGTGTIVNNSDGPVVIYASVTSGGANNIVVLPAPIVGTEVWLQGNATGYELRSSSPTTVAINGGTGADAEAAIAASLVIWARCTSPTTWVVNNFAAIATEAAEEAAA